MIRHTLSFRFKDDVDTDTRDEILAALGAFPGRYPTMQGFSLGENISNRDATFTHTMSVDFDSEDELLAYLSSESHETFVRERWRPVIAQRAITSYEFAPATTSATTERGAAPV